MPGPRCRLTHHQEERDPCRPSAQPSPPENRKNRNRPRNSSDANELSSIQVSSMIHPPRSLIQLVGSDQPITTCLVSGPLLIPTPQPCTKPPGIPVYEKNCESYTPQHSLKPPFSFHPIYSPKNHFPKKKAYLQYLVQDPGSYLTYSAHIHPQFPKPK